MYERSDKERSRVGMIKYITDKSLLRGRAYIYAKRKFKNNLERDIFMQGVEFAIKRTL